MEQQLDQLQNLLKEIPSYNSSSCHSHFNTILNKYLSILNYVNSHSEYYKVFTNLYYNDIADIRDNLQMALYSNSHESKISAFEHAGNILRSNVIALKELITPKEIVAEVYS